MEHTGLRTENDKIQYEKMVRKNYHRLTKYLIEKQRTVTTMESVTAGQIASLLTDTEGSSAVLKGAFITYSNEAKIQQGVPEETIRRYSVYSKETAAAMAQACRKAYQADIGIGVTGTAANADPENQKASVPGTVYYAIALEGKTTAFEKRIPPQPDRLFYKLAVAEQVLEVLWPMI